MPIVTWERPIYNSTFDQYIGHPNPCIGTFVRIAQHGDSLEVSQLKDMFVAEPLRDDDFARSVYRTSSSSKLDVTWLADSTQGLGIQLRHLAARDVLPCGHHLFISEHV